MRAGKKKRGSGGNEFLPARSVWGWESVSAIPASAGRQNRKIFVSLIEKNLGGAQLKNVKKIFLFCSPSGEWKRWAGFLPVRAEIVARKRFELRLVGVPGIELGPPRPFFFRAAGSCTQVLPTPRVNTTVILQPENLVRGQGSVLPVYYTPLEIKYFP